MLSLNYFSGRRLRRLDTSLCLGTSFLSLCLCVLWIRSIIVLDSVEWLHRYTPNLGRNMRAIDSTVPSRWLIAASSGGGAIMLRHEYRQFPNPSGGSGVTGSSFGWYHASSREVGGDLRPMADFDFPMTTHAEFLGVEFQYTYRESWRGVSLVAPYWILLPIFGSYPVWYFLRIRRER